MKIVGTREIETEINIEPLEVLNALLDQVGISNKYVPKLENEKLNLYIFEGHYMHEPIYTLVYTIEDKRIIEIYKHISALKELFKEE